MDSKKRPAWQGAAGLEAILSITKSSFAGNEKCKDGTRTMLPPNGSTEFEPNLS
jgi:hypothetical protein